MPQPQLTAPEELVARVEELSERFETVEPVAREIAEELLAAMLELYGEGLERIFQALAEGGAHTEELRDRLVEDGVVGSLLLIHDLHPIPLEARVREALDSVRPYMESHGGGVELVSLDDDVARLRLEGSCDGCRASASTLELAIRRALDEAAPDLAGIEVEGVVEAAPQPPRPLKPLPLLGSEPAPAAAKPFWASLDGLAVAEGELAPWSVDGRRLVVANVRGTLLAYLDRCAACGDPLVGGELDGGVLSCPSCARRFDLPRAGRSLEPGDPQQLSPVPLLAEDGGVRVAVAT